MNRWGIQSVQQMRLEGWTKESLTSAVQLGTIHRTRRGYYNLPGAPLDLVRAVRVGGQATGQTALPYLGIWKPPGSGLCVLVPVNAARLRDPRHRLQRLDETEDVHIHWRVREPVRPNLVRFTPIVDPLTAVLHAIECSPDDFALAIIDSALHNRVLVPADIPRLGALLPRHRHPVLAMADGRAEAGGESVARYRLRMAGFDVQIQVVIRGVGRVDILVNGRLVIEIDGRSTHDTAAQFEDDRRRDRELANQRYGHLRFTYRQVFDEWPQTLAAVAAALD